MNQERQSDTETASCETLGKVVGPSFADHIWITRTSIGSSTSTHADETQLKDRATYKKCLKAIGDWPIFRR